MFKLGICTIGDLMAAERSFGRKQLRRNYYIGLYEDVIAANGSADSRWQEWILDPFAINNAVFKRTARDRFSEFDTKTLELLCDSPAVRESCVVHDMAVSDGRTACDFFDKLVPEFGDEMDFYATDLCLRVYSLRQPGGRLTLVVDHDDKILQLVFPPFVLPVSINERWLFYPVNRLLRAVLMRTTVKRLVHFARAGNVALERREILLLCQQARQYLQRYPNFHVESYDMLTRPLHEYAVVRAMNIFNRTYFSDDILAKAVRNVFESLKEGGVFVTGSNQDAGSTVNGSIYRKHRGRFLTLYQSADSSPVDHLVTAI